MSDRRHSNCHQNLNCISHEFFVKLESQRMFFKVLLQGGIPSIDLGFKNLLKGDNEEDFKLGAIFSTRGQQILNLNGKIDLNSLTKSTFLDFHDLSFNSNLIFNTNSQDFSQSTLFKLPLSESTLAKAHVNIEEGEVEVGTAVEYKINDDLTVEGFISFLKNSNISLLSKYSPENFLDLELEYSNPFRSDEKIKPFPTGSLTSRCLFKANENTDLAGEYIYNCDRQEAELTLGMERRSENSVVRAKVDDNYDLEVSIKYDWDEDLKLFASTRVGLENIARTQESELGFG